MMRMAHSYPCRESRNAIRGVNHTRRQDQEQWDDGIEEPRACATSASITAAVSVAAVRFYRERRDAESDPRPSTPSCNGRSPTHDALMTLVLSLESVHESIERVPRSCRRAADHRRG
jgi:hypothetical protein